MIRLFGQKKHKVRRPGRFATFLIRAFMVILGYYFLIYLLALYLPLPGFRAAGEPLNGGWQWGSVGACYDDLPVMQFVDDQAYLVVKGERVWHFIENVSTRSDENYFYMEGVIDIPKKYSTTRFDYPSKKFRVKIKYKDLGKALIVKEMFLDGATINDKNAKYYSLTECGYPYFWNYLARVSGIKKYWQES